MSSPLAKQYEKELENTYQSMSDKEKVALLESYIRYADAYSKRCVGTDCPLPFLGWYGTEYKKHE